MFLGGEGESSSENHDDVRIDDGGYNIEEEFETVC